MQSSVEKDVSFSKFVLDGETLNFHKEGNQTLYAQQKGVDGDLNVKVNVINCDQMSRNGP